MEAVVSKSMAQWKVTNWFSCVVIGAKVIPLYAIEGELFGVYFMCDDSSDNILRCGDAR